MTALPIVYDVQARTDLKGQFDYIFEQSGAMRAIEFVDRIEVFVENLSAFPEMGRMLTMRPASLRAIAFRGQAYIVYTVQPRRILVLRIFNKGQDVDAWLQLLLGEVDQQP